MAKSLAFMMGQVANSNRDKGWYDQHRSFPEDLALLHSEVSEALEAYRDNRLHHTAENGKPDDVPSELADVFIRLLDICYRYNFDLEAEFERKHAFNLTRPYRHGNKAL